MAPHLIREPPTNSNILYTGLMKIKNIAPKDKWRERIDSGDMQLYDIAMKLWCSINNISQSFLFRPGELHVMFWSLAALGKYV